LREELGRAPAVLGGHHPVLAGPDDEGGAVEVRQAFGRRQHSRGVTCVDLQGLASLA
jgi:hypothetical protein